VKYQVTIQGSKPLVKDLRRLGDKIRDARPALIVVNEYLADAMKKNFESQGRRGGGSWRKLSEGWQKRKAREGRDPRIGFYTGALFAAATDVSSTDRRIKMTKTSLNVTIALPYAAVQQDERPFAKFTKGDTLAVRGIIADHVLSSMRSRRGR
jgi:hypothetical protein